jgi:DNA primase
LPFKLKGEAEINQAVVVQTQREQEIRESFRHKVAIQQFMNANGPIFRAFANRGVQVEDIKRQGVLNGLIGNAVALATHTAAKIYRKNVADVTPSEARPFRVGAAEWVAAHWTSGKQIDVQFAAEQIASAAQLADAKWDHDIFKDDRISSDASKYITAAAVAGELTERVAIYHFRLDFKVALHRVINEVVTHASKSARAMLPEASEAEVSNLTQTIARTLSNLMQACYDQKARDVVKSLRDKSENDIAAYFEANQPFEEVISNFRKWADWLAWISPIAATQIAKPSAAANDGDDSANEMHPD